MIVEVRLTTDEIAYAHTLAQVRQTESENKGLKGAHGVSGIGPEALRIHQIGALGEVAVAKYLGLDTPATVNTFRAPDLGEHLQVRTGSHHQCRLIVRDTDANDDLFVLATTETDRYVRLRGWIDGAGAKQPSLKRAYANRPPAYFVPVTMLSPVSTLRLSAVV